MKPVDFVIIAVIVLLGAGKIYQILKNRRK